MSICKKCHVSTLDYISFNTLPYYKCRICADITPENKQMQDEVRREYNARDLERRTELRRFLSGE